MSEPAPPTARPTRTQRSGCLLALYIMLGLGALVLVTVGIGIWLFVRSEPGQQWIGVAGRSISLMQQAQRAPGTDALRAAGCAQAMVMPVGKMAELIGEITPHARKQAPESFAARTLVLCQINTGDGSGPDCAEVARIYAGAAPEAPDGFSVIVQDQGRGQPRCQRSYGRTGATLEPLEREQ
jgi:hypothetical protein